MSTQPNAAAAVGAEVRGLLAKHKISQTSAGTRLGLSQSAMSRRLAGEIAFNVDELAALADLIGVPVSDLLGKTAA